MTTEITTVHTADDPLVLSIARVAHEVVGAHNAAYGDYVGLSWEQLPEAEQAHARAKVAAFLNAPGLSPTSQHGPAVATLSSSQRAAAAVFKGVVTAIAREQAR